MIAQRQLLHRLTNNSSAPLQMVVTKHSKGDLHYGFGNPRNAAILAMAENEDAGGVSNDDGIKTVDDLNRVRITPLMQQDDNVKDYFDIMDSLRTGAFKTGSSLVNSWHAFLLDNIQYLDLGKHIKQLDQGTPASPTKDKLNKNGLDIGNGQSIAGKRNAITVAYKGKTTKAVDSAYHTHVKSWMWDAFFRRTSKLGIKFTVENKRVIHFNLDAPATGNRPASDVATEATKRSPGRQPITHSELRYINRNGFWNTKHVDAYDDVDALKKESRKRKPKKAKMKEYLADRKKWLSKS